MPPRPLLDAPAPRVVAFFRSVAGEMRPATVAPAVLAAERIGII
jgi:hypothetical protein